MFNYTAVTSKGQAVIPKPIRDQFGIKPNSRVGFSVQNGKIVVDVVPTVSSMRGFIKTNIKLSDEELEKMINEASAEGAIDDYMRSLTTAEKRRLRKQQLKK